MKRKIIFVLISVFVLSFAFPLNVSAASGINKIDAFQNIEDGDGQYIKYSDNYHLDRIDPGIFDKWRNNAVDVISNFFFGIFKEFSYLTVVAFYHCFSFNVAEMFRDQLSDIQSGLRAVFFDGAFFFLVFAASAFYMIKQLMKGNLQNLLSEIIKVVAILLISQAVVTESVPFLTFVNTFTKQISVEALGGISGQPLSASDGNASLKTYAADAAGILWSGLVHKPWVALEFGEDCDEAVITQNTPEILSKNRTSDEREDLVERINDSKGLFDEAVGWNRIFPSIMMALPIIIKCIFYLILAVLQFGFQILTLFYVILCPLILLLAVSPQLGGMDLIWSWLKKIAETQISVLILTFVIGLIVSLDNTLAGLNSFGWLIGLWFQVAAMVILVLNWQKVLRIMSGVTRKIQNPNLAMRQFQYSGNMYDGLSHGIPAAAHGVHQIGSAAAAAGKAFENGVVSAYDGITNLPQNLRTNYNKIKPYIPIGYASISDTEPTTPEKAKVQPKKLNTEAIKNYNRSDYAENINANAKVIDFNKIPRYEPKRKSTEPVQRPVSYSMAVNGGYLPIINKTTSEATQRPYTVNYSARASNYTAGNRTSPEAVQRPRTAEYKTNFSKGAAPVQVPHTAPQKPTNEKADFNTQRPAIKNASVISNARQFVPKPVVKDFEFKPQKPISKSAPAAPRSSSEPIVKPKPVVEQFNFKVHTDTKK